ncbi:MAG: iron ABC transporter permease [Pseudomonadota bacterium]
MALFYGGPAVLENNPTGDFILWHIRAPKLVAAILIGAALSLSGYVFQTVLRNPLADPYILGISSGAALGVSVFLTLFTTLSTFGFELAAFLGAGLALILLILFYRLLVHNTVVMVLIGVGLSFFFSSVITALMSYMEGDKIVYMNSWLIGNISQPEYKELLMLGSVLVVVSTIILFLSTRLDALKFGDDFAKSSGVNSKFYSIFFIILASMLAAGCVTVCGTLGFIGLVVPHIVRLVIKETSAKVIPAVMLFGSAFLVLCTALSGILSFRFDVPVGAVTAFIGAPVLIYLIYTRYRGRA